MADISPTEPLQWQHLQHYHEDLMTYLAANYLTQEEAAKYVTEDDIDVELLNRFSVTDENVLLFDGKPIEGGGSGADLDPIPNSEIQELFDN